MTTLLGSRELLPEPITRPLDPADVLGPMRGVRRRLAEQAIGERPVYFHVRSGSWADIGGWLGPRSLDVFAMDAGLLLLAAGWFEFEGKRPLVVEVPCSDLRESTYNYATGRLALAPGGHCPVAGLKVPPREAQQLLAQIHHEG